MKIASLVALTCGAFAATAIAGPFDQFRGKVKEGLYEYKMEMEMPGMPPGMAKGPMTFTHCVTAQDIEKGQFGRGGRDGKQPDNCEVKDVNMTGSGATYKVICKPPQEMTMDVKMTFKGDGFVMDNNMSMNQGGRMMNMKQRMESTYKGACK